MAQMFKDSNNTPKGTFMRAADKANLHRAFLELSKYSDMQADRTITECMSGPCDKKSQVLKADGHCKVCALFKKP